MSTTSGQRRGSTRSIWSRSAAFARGGARAFRQYPAAILLIVVILLCYFGGPLFGLPGPSDGSLNGARLAPFTDGHLLGTDGRGNDLLSRVLYAGRYSFLVGVAAVLLGLVLGVSIGLVAAFWRGPVDVVLMRLIDIQLAFPALVLALALAAYLGAGLFNVIVAVAFFAIPANARLARAAALRAMANDYVTSTRLLGRGRTYILIRHVLPNIWGELMTFNFIKIGNAMIIEAILSFLGLGIRPPTPSWGSMISEGANDMSTHAWIMLVPTAFLFVAVLAVNLTGDVLRSKWESR